MTNSEKYFAISAMLDSENMPVAERKELLREVIALGDSLGFTMSVRSRKNELLWLMKSHEQQAREIPPYTGGWAE